MKQYPESESLAIKRLKVAIEKKNWELFQNGMIKAREMKEYGHKWTNLDLWQKLLLWAESEDIPPNLWESLSDFINEISGSIYEEPEIMPLDDGEVKENLKITSEKAAIFYHRSYDKNIYSFIKKHRVNLVNYCYYKNEYLADNEWLNQLSILINELNLPSEDLKGFLSLLSSCNNEGSIITTSYATNIIKMLMKSGKNFFYPGVNSEDNIRNYWDFYPLGGTVNTFLCTSCKHMLLKTDFSSRTILESCPKCSAVMIPDLSDISSDNSEVNPKLWYSSFGKLVNNKVWILINPPSINESTSIKNLILESAKVSKVEKIYIISSKHEIFEWWRSKIFKYLPNVEIKGNYINISMFLDSHKKEPQEQNF